VNAHWNRSGYKNAPPLPVEEFQKWLDDTQPRYKLTWYNDPGDTDQEALITVRDKKRVFNLTLARSGDYETTAPYFSIPFANNITSGAPDQQIPLLIPRIVQNGTPLYVCFGIFPK
jgi:hypothetical protein